MHCCLCWRKVCARVAGKRVGRWQKAVSGPHNETNPGQLRTAGKVGACHRTPGRLEPPPAIYELEHRGFSCCLYVACDLRPPTRISTRYNILIYHFGPRVTGTAHIQLRELYGTFYVPAQYPPARRRSRPTRDNIPPEISARSSIRTCTRYPVHNNLFYRCS